jgi:hypothetical protein
MIQNPLLHPLGIFEDKIFEHYISIMLSLYAFRTNMDNNSKRHSNNNRTWYKAGISQSV